MALFLQAVSPYFYICFRCFETCEPAPQQPGFRVLNHIPGCHVLPCHERRVMDVGIRLMYMNKQPNYRTYRSQYPQKRPCACPQPQMWSTQNRGEIPGWEGGNTGRVCAVLRLENICLVSLLTCKRRHSCAVVVRLLVTKGAP